MSLKIFDAALQQVLTGPAVRQAVAARTDLAVDLVKLSLSRPWPGGPGPFPPPGPPFMRTGELRDSIQATDPTVDGDGVVAGVEATAVHRGWNYGNVLRDRGYLFIDLALLRA